MQFSITPSSQQPIYAQIVQRVREAIANGSVAPGERLPTVRELAQRLVVNPNTIAKAYAQLEREGVVYTKKGAGTFVAEVGSVLSGKERRKLLIAQVDRMLTESVHLGFSRQAVERLVADRMKRFSLPEEDGK